MAAMPAEWAGVHEIPAGAIAGPWRRLGGSTIDMLVVGGPFLVLVLSLSTIDLERRVFETPGWITAAGAVTGLLYEVLLTARDGQTLGKKVVHTRVVTHDTLAVPTLRAAVVRALPQVLSLVPLLRSASLLVYAPIVWRSDRRGIHDHLARTVVVHSDY